MLRTLKKSDEMRNLLNLSILSKFKVNSSVLKLEKYPQFFCKSFTFHKKHSSFSILSVRCYAFINAQIRCVSIKSGKSFREIENEYAHAVMEKLPGYLGSLLTYPLVTEKNINGVTCSNKNIFHQFANVTVDNLSVALSLENKAFSDLVKKLCSSLREASDEEIQRTLHHLCLWPPTSKTYTPNFKALWNRLDEECARRMENWNVNHKLLIADYWFYLRLSRITQYNFAMIANLVKNIDSLSTQQIVQLMFYINLQRNIPQLFLPNIEKQLKTVISSMAIEEVGIICLGFFKTKNKISDLGLIRQISSKFIKNVETKNLATLAAILKFLRKSLRPSLTEVYISILHKSVPYIKNWDIPTSVHLALLSSESNVFHPLLLNKVCEKLIGELADSRIKDCAKLLHCLSRFNYYYKKELHDLILSEVLKEERQKEVYSHPQYVVQLALYYAYLGEYNSNLLSVIFQKNFIQYCSTYRPETIPVIVEIDYCVEIECPDYSGPKLDKGLRKVLENRRGNLPVASSQQNMQTRLLDTVYHCLLEILGSNENICIKHILPNFYSPDIIVRLFSKDKKSLSDICQDFPSDVALVPPSKEIWACFVVGGAFSFAYRSKHMSGITAMKLRQLKKIGYNSIFIPFFDLPLDISQRKQFLKEQLNALESKYCNQKFVN